MRAVCRTVGAMMTAVVLLAAMGVSSAAGAFDIESFSGVQANSDGTSATQSGAHPSIARWSLTFPTSGADAFGEPIPEGSPKNIIVDVPPGFIGNPGAVPARCTAQELTDPNSNGGLCPDDSQVGVANVSGTPANLYEMVAPPGTPALLGFRVGQAPVFLVPSLRTGENYGIRVTSRDINQSPYIKSVVTTLWGVPGDHSHDGERGLVPPEGIGPPFPPGAFAGLPCSTMSALGFPCSNEFGVTPEAFLTNGVSCAEGDAPTSLRVDEWAHPGIFHTASFSVDSNGQPTGGTGCDVVPFNPMMRLDGTSHEADSPTGLEVHLSVPTAGLLNPHGIAQANLKTVTVTFPDGMSINPSSAVGLGSCSTEQIELSGSAPAQCPDESKVGTVSIQTPLLDHALDGSVYLARQFDNKFRSLIALYIAVDDSRTGTVIKLAGRVEANIRTGRLQATFDDAPQVPFSSFDLSFFKGSHAPLITPPTCGSYEIVSRLSSWSATDPDNPTPAETVEVTNPLNVTSGPDGAPCPAPNQFDPTFEAGTQTPIAGAYSPLIVSAARPDGSSPLSGLSIDLPEGLLGKLAGTPACSQAALSAAEAKSGAAELASPSCPAASKVGSVDVAAGAGATPFHVTGQIYLSTPYEQAPISLAVITPALAGPFDLGTVVTRAALSIDPVTTKVHVASDPIPTILQGIPLKVRSILVNTDRPEFTLNPTDCDPMSLAGTLVGASVSKSLSSRFQVGACKALDFKPKLSLNLSGPTGRSKNPALRAVLTQPAGQANIGRVSVVLPKSAFIDNAHINNPCTRVQFNANACPKKSILGSARAFTPLLDQPLEGPVYFRSNGGERELPDLVADLNGQIHVTLVGFIDSVKKKGSETSRVRNTFALVPDAPVSRFVLNLKGGKVGLIENSANICRSDQHASIKMDAQSGKVYDTMPLIDNDCGKGKSGRR
jgi:hypothetical protein